MNSKQDVKYLIAAMTLSLGTCSVLSATEYSKASETEPTTVAAEEIQTIELIEQPAEKVDIPSLAQPETNTSIDIPNEETEVELITQAQLSITTTPLSSDPMPIVNNKTNSYIPLVEGAVIFSNDDDALPAIVNYYTQASTQEIIDFYQKSFGEVITQESKRGRLTLTYTAENLAQRVIVSEQNGKRQVDVIVEEKSQ